MHLAADTRLGRRVALKTLLPSPKNGFGRDGFATLLREARIVGALSHPNIVPLYDAAEDGGAFYLVFEYVEGRTLAQVIREQGKLEVERAVGITASLARAIAYAHERDVLHRDLKPANVMLTGDGVPRLMDFGIASGTEGAEVGAHALVGTPSYMAPEYIAEGLYTHQSDMFALGVVLYEMLTGEKPFHASQARETVRLVATAETQPPSRRNQEIDERLDALVMKALAQNPGGGIAARSGPAAWRFCRSSTASAPSA